MIRYFKAGESRWEGRCSVDTLDPTCCIWHREWPIISSGPKLKFSSSLDCLLEHGYWVEDTSLELDVDILVDEGL